MQALVSGVVSLFKVSRLSMGLGTQALVLPREKRGATWMEKVVILLGNMAVMFLLTTAALFDSFEWLKGA
jgi:hypothetical protein